jgi:hypothetical protein
MRRLLSAAAATLALFAASGLALAVPLLGTLDQYADVGSTTYAVEDPAGVTQTFTPSQNGMLVTVELYCGTDEAEVDVTLTVGGTPTVGYCDGGADWIPFLLALPVQAGQPITMAISAASTFQLGVASADYAGGSAASGGAPIGGVTDFAFKTYLTATSSTTYSWSVSQVQPGVSTTVSLTTTTSFGEVAAFFNAVQATGPNAVRMQMSYAVKLDGLPSWFTPSAMTCSAQIAQADCTLDAYKAGIEAIGDGTAMAVVITIDGTATPATSEAGQTGNATGQGCVSPSAMPIVVPNLQLLNVCSSGTAALGVGAAATPPASSSVEAASAVSGSGVAVPTAIAIVAGWLLLAGLAIRRRRSC